MTTPKPQKSAAPTVDQLTELLGSEIGLWTGLQEAVRASHAPVIREALAVETKAIEGWPVRMPVRTADDLAAVVRLVEIKLSAR